ncbi:MULTISPECIES: AMP-binding protein [unclassified Uliginosibacterium]|uniref:AMP-binding protein n=1 Tax=unclassified Uliginosibacterium TaxID=2621521 RepID=UPI000C7DC634|nr:MULTISPECIES: AMP-binding protein [unclassified Uliginosibacterium]MDO6387293.1 AMP-binding protein [Uliginosibacterium sp. 31-12]PLK50695.1 bifunctional 2-acylglycerophosphoethanolamine acyltransferase/acyl-ACP synthetase [Uliginosibacterium sp. TH139]
MLRLILKGLLRPLFRLVFRVQVHGEADIRAERLLIVANHESFLDELLLGLFLPQRPVVVVYSSASCSRVLRFFARGLVDYLTIDPNNPMELKTVIRLIETGRPVLIFPEGRITTTGNLMKTYDGPGFIAAKSGATLLPVRIEGAARSYFSLLQGHYSRSLFPKIRLFVQEPTLIETAKAAHGEQHYLAGQAMHRVMTDLMFAGRAEQTLLAALLEAARIQGRNWRLLGDVEHVDYSYSDILRTALVLGRKLAARSAENERFGVLLPNVAALLALVFGLGAFRRPPAMLNYTAGVDGMQAACSAACIRQIITSRKFIEQFKLGDKLARLQGVEFIYLEDLRREVSLADRLWWLCFARHRPLAAVPASRPEDPAVVMFTSGSEGKCKGVVLSHRAILANVSQLRSVLDFSVNDVIVNALPLFHSFGLTCGGMIPLLCGAKVFLYPSPLHYRVIPELAYNASCTILFGTNTFLANYAKHAHPFDFYRLRYVVAGAEKITDSVRQAWFEKFGTRIFEGYGATECAPVLSVNTQMAYRSGSVGKFLPSIEYRIQPLPGVESKDGQPSGQLHVRGPNLMSGYLRHDAPGILQPPHSEIGPGWYDTGDIVEIDAEGFVHVLGRVKRFAKVAGEMVSLGAVELLAGEAAPEGQHAAIALSDDERGETILLYTTATGLARETLLATARSKGSPELAVPRRIVYLDALPLLGSGKVDYPELKRLAAA